MPGVLILTQPTSLIGGLRHDVRFLLINFKRWRLVGRHLCVLLIQIDGIVFHTILLNQFFLKYLEPWSLLPELSDHTHPSYVFSLSRHAFVLILVFWLPVL